jgi:outer membrane protein assembly factor BamB
MGNVARSPFLNETVSSQPPTVMWSTTVGSGLRGTPVVTDETVVVVTSDRKIHTLSREDGSKFWQKRLAGPAVPPLVVGEVIITATEDKGRIESLDMAEGADLWRYDLPSVATPITLHNDTLYLAAEDGSLFAFVPGSDTPIYQAFFQRAASAGPVIFDAWIAYVAYDSLFVLDRPTAQRQAAASNPEVFVGEAASDGEAIYLATERGSLIAFTIPELQFLWQASGFGNFEAGPVLADSLGYAVTRTGKLVRFNAQSGAARILADVGGTVIAPPTVVQNGVLVGTVPGYLHFLSRNGEPIWDVELDGSVEWPVFVHEGRIIVPIYKKHAGGLSSGSRGMLMELR